MSKADRLCVSLNSKLESNKQEEKIRETFVPINSRPESKKENNLLLFFISPKSMDLKYEPVSKPERDRRIRERRNLVGDVLVEGFHFGARVLALHEWV